MSPPFESYTTIVCFVISHDYFFLLRGLILKVFFSNIMQVNPLEKLNLTTKNKHREFTMGFQCSRCAEELCRISVYRINQNFY
jgi:hypothetical protein